MQKITRGGCPEYTESATAKVSALAGDTRHRRARQALMTLWDGFQGKRAVQASFCLLAKATKVYILSITERNGEYVCMSSVHEAVRQA
jgi:hypothetical protein